MSTQETVPAGRVGTMDDPATARLARPGSLPSAAEQAAAAKDKPLCSPATLEMARQDRKSVV